MFCNLVYLYTNYTTILGYFAVVGAKTQPSANNSQVFQSSPIGSIGAASPMQQGKLGLTCFENIAGKWSIFSNVQNKT